MESTRFDRITRTLASAPSRRTMLRGALGLAAVAAVPAIPAAACVDVDSNRDCQRDNDCCGKDSRCRNGRCQCKSGFRACRDNGQVRCFDRRNDADHCGGCGKRCRNGESCVQGSCTYGGDGNCTIHGFCGAGRPNCCPGFACRAGQPDAGLGGCVPA